jgi:serine phosphatase RsbU (regulator of sigma subunit)
MISVKKICIFSLLLLFISNAYTASLDSLIALLPQVKDTQEVMVNFNIGKQYSKNRKYNEALQFFNKSLEQSKKLNFQYAEALNLHYIAKMYSRKVSYDTSEVFFKKSLLLFDKINELDAKIECLNDYAILFYYKGDYSKAISICFSALNQSNSINDKKIIGRLFNNLGNCYYFQKDFKKALLYYTKAYNFELKGNDKTKIANSLGNIGLIHFEMGDYDESLKKHLLSYNLQKEIGDTNEMAASLINISIVYEKLNQLNKALTYAQESLKLRRLINDERRIAFSMIKVAYYEAHSNNFSSAEKLYSEAIDIAMKNGSLQYLMEAYDGLSDAYANKGDYKNALIFHRKFTATKDSIFSQTTAEEIAEAQEKYESVKKQRALEILQKDKVINEIKYEKNKSYLYITLIIIASIFTLLALLFKQYRSKQKNNLLLAEQNQLITVQKKEITDSIHYANIIQRAMLPLSVEVNQLFPTHFIYYQPKDIVSGDFYWCGQKNNLKALVVADCTGHGVPGAMMSMVGNNLLNQAFYDHQLKEPNEILDFIDVGIRKNLHQNNQLQSSKNSMDLSICIIDEPNKKIIYGGSINPIYLIRNNELLILKTDKIPLGYSHGNVQSKFNKYIFDYQKGDRIYMFTDGIPDQFGGAKGKKLMTKNFQAFLLKIQSHELQMQEKKFHEFISEWKLNFEQTDDMLMFAIEL